MLRSLQETKYDSLLLLLLLLLQPSYSKFKQKKQQQQRKLTHLSYESSTKDLRFSDLQYIYMSTHASHSYASVNWDITISY